MPALTLGWLTPFYGFLAETFGYGSKFKELVLDRLSVKSPRRILDVGCGTGTLVILAKKKWSKADVAGIDIDAEILDIARKEALKEKVEVEFRRASAAKLPFAGGTFDVVVSTLMWHHMPREVKLQAMAEAHRVLKKEGKFLLADWTSAPSWLRWVFRLLEPVAVEARTVRDNLEGKLPEWLKEAGFSVKELKPKYRGVQFWLGTKQKKQSMSKF